MARKTLAERFDAMMCPEPNTGCWLWMGAVNYSGYGLIGVKPSRSGRAHRVSYELHKGPIPPGMEVCHQCDVRSCVNPDHLFLGTRQENAADCKAKRRTAVGDKIGIAKLDWRRVSDIRKMLAAGLKQSHIAKEFCVDRSVISEINTGKIWKRDRAPSAIA